LVSFTAIRGIKPLVESSTFWRGLQAGEAPDQVYAWALRGIPSQSYFAAIWPDSSNRFENLSDRLVQAVDAHVVPDGLGKPGRMTNASSVVWTGNPFSQPFLQHKTETAGEIVLGGFSAVPPAGQPIPSVLLHQFKSQTNVLYYDWELTESRVAGWVYLGQLLRFATGKSQLGSNSAGLRWLQAVGPKLGNSATIVHQTAPNKLTVSRTSSAGFTGIELQGLMDWIESPNFPHGLQSLDSTPDPRLYRTAPQIDKSSNDPSVRTVVPR
jgi:hypothetical protein